MAAIVVVSCLSLACPFCCPYKFHIIYADRRYVQPAARNPTKPNETFQSELERKGRHDEKRVGAEGWVAGSLCGQWSI